MHDAAITVRSSGSRRMTCDSRWRILFSYFLCMRLGLFGMEISMRGNVMRYGELCTHEDIRMSLKLPRNEAFFVCDSIFEVFEGVAMGLFFKGFSFL